MRLGHSADARRVKRAYATVLLCLLMSQDRHEIQVAPLVQIGQRASSYGPARQHSLVITFSPHTEEFGHDQSTSHYR